MKPVLADTFFFLAAVNPKDSAHSRAIAWSDSYDGPLVTTAWVITELADALADHRHRQTFSRLYRTMMEDPRLRIIPAQQALLERGLRWYFDRPDKDWSLTDCISFAVMNDEALSEALTGDHHFGQAGFAALLC